MMLIFRNAMSDADVENTLGRVGDEIGRLGGTVKNTESMGDRIFARPMKKQESGRYVKLLCDLDPAQIDALQARFRLMDDVFRVQIVHHVVPPVSPKAADDAGKE